MLFDLEIIIQQALVQNKKIVDYVAKINGEFPNIGANRTPQGAFPLIEYHQIYGSDELFGDDVLLSRQYAFQIGIYTEKPDYYEVQNVVDEVMRDIGFTCYNDYTYSLDTTKVFHRIFSYTIKVTEDSYKELLKKYKIGDDF